MHVSAILAAMDYGWYVNIWKIVAVLLVVLLWARLLTWMDKDAVDAHLPRLVLNTAFLGGLIGGFILFLAVPGFWVALAIFLVVLVLEIGTYLAMRHAKVGLKDLGQQFSAWIRSFTSKEKEIKAEAGEVLLIDRKGNPFPPPDAESPARAAFAAVQIQLTDPLRRGADRIDMRASDSSAASVKYWVDGVDIAGRSIPKDDAAAAVTFLKQLGGMDLNDRRKPQLGTMKTALDGKKRELQVQTAGSTAGESVVLQVEPKKRYDLRLDQMGFTDEQIAVVEEVIGDGQGIVLLAAPKGHGLTALLYAVLRRHDA